MKIAIISDIHSNPFAFNSVLHDLRERGIDRLIVLGDIFGYYPWAVETFDLLKPYLDNSWFIKGNHDQLLLETKAPQPEPSYWKAAQYNRTQLIEREPKALDWLRELPFSRNIEIDGTVFNLFHGTPSDQINGRFYPDSIISEKLFSGAGRIFLLGHTHYPLIKKDGETNNVVFNPGSVGQPRDGNPMPSWGIFDSGNKSFSFERSFYDYKHVVDLLTEMNWDKHAIAAVQKNHSGNLFDKK